MGLWNMKGNKTPGLALKYIVFYIIFIILLSHPDYMKHYLILILLLTPAITFCQWNYMFYVGMGYGDALITRDGTIYSWDNVYRGTPASGYEYTVARNDTVLMHGINAYSAPVGKMFFVNRDTGFIFLNFIGYSGIKQTNDAGTHLVEPSCNLDLQQGYPADFMYRSSSEGYGLLTSNNPNVIFNKCINGNHTSDSIPGLIYYPFKMYFLNRDTGFIYLTDMLHHPYLLRTGDGGLTWDTAINDQTTRLNHICFVTDRIGYVTGSKGVLYKTTDGGSQWHKSIIDTTVNIYESSFVNDSCGYLAGSGGKIYYTNNAALSWRTLQFPVNEDIIHLRFVSDSIGFAITGSYSRSAFKTTTGGFHANSGTSLPERQTPKVFPNPCYNECRIVFSGKYAGSGMIFFEVLTADGRLVFADRFIEGNGPAVVRLHGLSSGIYVLHLNDNGRDEYLKIIKL